RTRRPKFPFARQGDLTSLCVIKSPLGRKAEVIIIYTPSSGRAIPISSSLNGISPQSRYPAHRLAIDVDWSPFCSPQRGCKYLLCDGLQLRRTNILKSIGAFRKNLPHSDDSLFVTEWNGYKRSDSQQAANLDVNPGVLLRIV